MVDKIRISLGTAIQLGLKRGDSNPWFSTAFLMTYSANKCHANCAFCPQARESSASSDRLSRISWPVYSIDEVISRWREDTSFERVCIQVLNYPNAVDDVQKILRQVRELTSVPVSLSIHPLETKEMETLHNAGVSSIGFALDACTPELFDSVKGKDRHAEYRWESHLAALREAVGVFGVGNVTTHLIIGLGETEKEAADFIFDMNDFGINVGLFAFTSIRGTSLEGHPAPDLGSYRRIQMVRYLAYNRLLQREKIEFTKDGKIRFAVDQDWLREVLSSGSAFQTSGCKGCNRPYYNESPRGPLYNYPRPLHSEEVEQAIEEAGMVASIE